MTSSIAGIVLSVFVHSTDTHSVLLLKCKALLYVLRIQCERKTKAFILTERQKTILVDIQLVKLSKVLWRKGKERKLMCQVEFLLFDFI